MEDNKYLEKLKKVRSIPVGRLVYSKKHQKWLKFLRVVTYGQHQGTVFSSGILQPVPDIDDIIPFANAGWDCWETAPHLFNIYDKIITTDGRIIPWSTARYDPSYKYISFAMKPEQYINNIIPGELLFVRIKKKGNYLVKAQGTTNDTILLTSYRPLDGAPLFESSLHNNGDSIEGICINGIELIRPAVRKEEVLFYNIAEPKEIKPDASSEELKPFKTKVLVANDPGDFWLPAVFWTIIKTVAGDRYAVVGGQHFKRCIIYKGENKKLLGTQVKLNNL